MKKLIITVAIFCMTGLSAGYAQHGMQGTGPRTLSAPANPTVPPSLAPDSRLIGSAPLPPHHQPTRGDVASIPEGALTLDPEDVKVDRLIGNICRGC